MGDLLDTNIITGFVKKNQILGNKLRQVEIEGEDILISAISYYEVKRGLLYVDATRQLSKMRFVTELSYYLWTS